MNPLHTLLIGLIAGAIATVVFTIVEYLDIAVTGRPVSMVPGQVAVALLGGDPHDDGRVKTLNLPTHFMHGTALGLVLAALAARSWVPMVSTLCPRPLAGKRSSSPNRTWQ